MNPMLKSRLKSDLFTALMVAPTLLVVVLSAVYQLLADLTGFGVTEGLPLVLGILTVLTLLSTTVLGVIWERRFPPALLAVIFWLCFFSYLGVVVSGTTDFVVDHFFEALTLVFCFPVFSYMSLAALFGEGVSVASLIMTGLFAALNTAVPLYLTIKRCRGGKHG